MNPETRQRRVALTLTVGLWAMLAALAGFLVYIGVTSADPLAARAARQHHMRIPIQPQRGNIVDARLRVLAGSQEAKSIFADPKVVTDPTDAATRVAPVLGLDRDEVYRQLTEDAGVRYVWLRRGVSPEMAEEARGLRLRGVSVVPDGERTSILADAKLITNVAGTASRVSALLGIDAAEVRGQLIAAAGSRFVWLKRRVSAETAEAVSRLDIDGIEMAPEGVRHYPNGSLAAHVLGCVGVEEQGLEGLERLFDQRLGGRAGEMYVLADRKRRPIWIEPDNYLPAEDGQHLVLTIDATIQAAAETALAATCAKFRAASGTAIVMDPRTGSLLALANVPTYDPGRYGAVPVDARRNRAVTDTFPPGSSGKPFAAAKALEAGVVHFGEVIYCEDGYWAAARLHDAGHSYGNLTFEQGLQKSSNIMLGKLGLRLGNARLHEALVAFGFGRASGVWLPGEAPGLVFPLAKWTRLSTTRVPFGQEYAVTPLQLVTAFAAFANGGRLVRPKIVRAVLDSRGREVVDLSQPEVLGQAMPPDVARRMIDRALVGVVEEGTGKQGRIPGYRVFGKTGTAQKVDPGGGISHSRYVGTFLTGAPAQDPRAVVLVVVDEPDKSIGYYGGTVAAPAAAAILEKTLTYLGVPRTEPIRETSGARLVQQDVSD